ncbi:hypothetical protein VT50_0221950 [Streptomyces antioxidans]|uniref:Secreted protein n=1 Tax=Streptomyces antioxidans TaxID=1507734 RepID=A0A1V4D2H0_9ACTN|nr:DUF6479 family protein [Streptomyces antioxidans]OPF77195.1 hypothetical protein VT50_0221950 [Streptomyces antioxidans]
MDTYAEDLAVTRDLLVGTGPFIVGLVVVILCFGAVWWGIRLRAREPVPPQRPQHRAGSWQKAQEADHEARAAGHGPGHQDDGDSVGYVTQNREPDELRPDRSRRSPSELGGSGTRDTGKRGTEDRPRWREGGSGSFGNG